MRFRKQQGGVKSVKLPFNGISTPDVYNHTGTIGALTVAVISFSFIWLINGLSTAWANRIPIYFVSRGIGNLLSTEVALTVGAVWGIGWIIHIAISLVERHMRRVPNRIFYILWIPCQGWDMLTSAMGFMMFFTGTLAGHGFMAIVLFTVLGFFLSLVEIPLVISIDYLIKAVRDEEE